MGRDTFKTKPLRIKSRETRLVLTKFVTVMLSIVQRSINVVNNNLGFNQNDWQHALYTKLSGNLCVQSV